MSFLARLNDLLDVNIGTVSNQQVLLFNSTSGKWEAGTIDLSTKIDKPASFTAGNLAEIDSNGNIIDSGSSTTDFASATHTHNISSLGEYDFVNAVNGKLQIGNFLFQWDSKTLGGSSSTSITFPVTYANVYGLQLALISDPATSLPKPPYSYNLTNTGFTLSNTNSNAVTISWLAFGAI